MAGPAVGPGRRVSFVHPGKTDPGPFLRTGDLNGLKKSLEDRGEVTGRMQNAKHLHALSQRTIENEIVFESRDRYDAHPLQILAPKVPHAAQTRQGLQLRIRFFGDVSIQLV